MKRLILMRHAKSGWSDLTLCDHERVLNGRGVASATAMGQWLRDTEITPDQVLCSDAARTRETLQRLALPETPTVFSRDWYLAEPDVMARALRKQTGSCVLMVGHNPGTAQLADQLVIDAPDHPQFEIFPTCATLVASFDITTWSKLKLGTGKVEHFAVPRDLID